MFLSYDIIILTKTWLFLDYSDVELGSDYFTIHRLDMNINNSSHSPGGGVLIAVNSSIISPITVTNPRLKHVFVLFSIDHSSLLIESTYLPHSSSILIIESHLSTIEQLLSNHKPDVVLLLEDYNMTCVSWTWSFYLWRSYTCFRSYR